MIPWHTIIAVCMAAAILLATHAMAEPNKPALRPPAVPLVTHDPYFCVWSMADHLTDDWPKHWTGTINAMCGLVRVDGTAYRYMGPAPADLPPMNQTSLNVTPTQTAYKFGAGGIELTVVFLSPLLPGDLELLGRPVTYVEWETRSTDGKPHDVSIYLDCTAEWAVNTPDQPVNWSRHNAGLLDVMSIGTAEQPVLAKKGDNLRIDWGHFLLAVPKGEEVACAIAAADTLRADFTESGSLPKTDDTEMPRAASDKWPAAACSFHLGRVEGKTVSRRAMLAYDDEYSIESLGTRLRPWWRRNGMDSGKLLATADAEYKDVSEKCRKFDGELITDLTKVGGAKYAQLASLALRQCLSAHKLAAGPDGNPMFFPKENFSNGCISTVDVIYPSSPLFLLFSTKLLRAQLDPVMEYAASPRWKFPFAPHDLGTYPLANGQVYGGGEETEENQMPVEESGNMLIILAAMADIDGNADYAVKYWPVISKWAVYLREKGMDPENQLCTDDFAGHLAHNANLSLKAIMGLGSYARLCEMSGRKEEAGEYRAVASKMAEAWEPKADDGDHYRLAFDKPGTWSQKYNLVWDRLLGFHLFPPEVAKKEIAFYLKQQNRYGLPLDNRSKYTKLDWVVWTATISSNRAEFEALTDPLFDFLNESPSRIPMTDWFWTHDGKVVGFQARSVVGGVYIPMLADKAIWKKWANRAK